MQNYYWKVYLWKDGKRGDDLTKYVMAPIFLEDKLDETLDTGEIILKRMPISTKTAYPPKTKFRIECYLDKEHTQQLDHWDMVVEHDDVEEYVGCPDICTHRIHLIEASVIAQGMHVDNIALTYELQDVDLNYKVVNDSSGDSLDALDRIEAQGNGWERIIHENQVITREMLDEVEKTGNNEFVYFINSYNYVWRDYDDLKSLKTRYNALNSHSIEFTIPTLIIQGAKDGEWVDICEAQTETTIIIKHCRGDEILSSKEQKIICGPTNLSETTSYPELYQVREMSGRREYYPTSIDGISSYTYLENGTWNEPFDFSDHYSLIDGGPTRSCIFTWENAQAKSKRITLETEILTDAQLAAHEYFKYEIHTRVYDEKVWVDAEIDGDTQHVMLQRVFPTYYETRSQIWYYNGQFHVSSYQLENTPTYHEWVNCNDIYFTADFEVGDTSTFVDGGAFLKKAAPYNCLQFLQKALLTVDTQVLDIRTESLDGLKDKYPIYVDNSAPDYWKNQLESCQMNETVFEQKNLWEVLIQIGYYRHAIPYLEFAEDGTDRFVLKFHQLGDTKQKTDSNTKITVFNSRNLSDYFTQYDSYVTNFFSPQNEVEEWLVPKTSDSSYLVSNDTAEIHTKYPIQGIKEFDLIYNGRSHSALNMIFEKAVYQVLTPSIEIRPSKASALYYSLGDNKILGLTYIPPNKNNGDDSFALKNILSLLFGTNPNGDIKFNDILFHIKYIAKDSLRISEVRPDIFKYMRSSMYEKYPHHEQFYGQQDKIVDSERFSANLFGKLIRVGNAVYQRQEYVSNAQDRKESGDLVMLGVEPYYVTAVENECYADAMLQKVTYSKNFNQLSNIVTIPSEPRFYEVSERSEVRREVRILDFLTLTTNEKAPQKSSMFIKDKYWQNFVRGTIFADTALEPPNFAYTRFQVDKKRKRAGCSIPDEKLFPSCEVERKGENSIVPKASSDHIDVVCPLMCFPLKNAIVFEWDMDDNFKAGDSIDTQTNEANDTLDQAYFSMTPVRYCDIFGRADLFRFGLFYKKNWDINQIRRLPFVDESDDFFNTNEVMFELPPNYAIALDKDNREALSFNYQINMVHNDQFLTFANLFGSKGSRLRMCLLNTEVPKFSETVPLKEPNLIYDNVSYSFDEGSNALHVKIEVPTGINISQVKSIVLYEEDAASKYAYICRNVANRDDNDKLKDWWIYPAID